MADLGLSDHIRDPASLLRALLAADGIAPLEELAGRVPQPSDR
jgi:hypothetical protein